ncbi:MAG TPA: glucose-1-phosphate cytidylyltransferase [Labilithrix sp.]|nr:glucose-1-phosphate cytidylyltransferase [Labilithrix sp.]
MKVVILCGGMGTRLREYTESIPKPMVRVGGVPILVHIMQMYAAAGMNEFVLCLGYLGHTIREYFLNYEAFNRDFTVELGRPGSIEYHCDGKDGPNWKVTLVETGASSMTGARLARAAKYLPKGETFAVTYGDGVADVPLADVLAFHRKHGRAATVTGVRPPSRFGEIEHESGLVRSFNEKPQVGTGLINGGFFFFEPSFLEYLSTDPACILEREPLERCVHNGQLSVYEHAGFWQCMDTYRDWERLEGYWKSGAPPWVSDPSALPGNSSRS